MRSNNSDNKNVFFNSLHGLQNSSKLSIVCEPLRDSGTMWSIHPSTIVIGLPHSQQVETAWNLLRISEAYTLLVIPYLVFAALFIPTARQHQNQVLVGSFLVIFLYWLRYANSHLWQVCLRDLRPGCHLKSSIGLNSPHFLHRFNSIQAILA